MRYTEFKVGDKEYKLRLTANEIINIEKKINGPLLKVIMNKDEVPTTTDLLLVLHGSLQKFNHGITMENTYDIYDEFVDAGGQYEGLLEKIIDVLEVSGFFKKDQIKEAKAKLEKEKKKK